MSILIYMLLAFWQAQYPTSAQPNQLPMPPRPATCASVMIRNQNSSDLWTVCTVEQFEQRVKQVNPEFLAGKSIVLYKPGQAPLDHAVTH